MRVMGLDDFSPWKPSHWVAAFGMWRGRRHLRKVMGERDLKQAIGICAKVAGKRVMWNEAASTIESFYYLWVVYLDERLAQAQERGRLPAEHFAIELTKILRECFGGNDEH